VKAPLAAVSQKYPSPDTAVKPVVFFVVTQFTVPVLPKPDWVAPEANATVPPHLPKVTVVASATTVLLAPPPTVSVDPDCCVIASTSILTLYYYYRPSYCNCTR